MMRKSFKLIAAAIVLTALLFSSFRLSEHIKGNRYVDYLKQHLESVELGENFSFGLMEADIKKHSLILVGEVHGFNAPTRFDPAFFGHLHQKHQVNTYFVEMDYSQAYFLNKYNLTGDENLLKRVFENWVVGQGRDNLDYLNRFKALREVFQQGEGFLYFGNNNVNDIELLASHIQELSGQPIPYNASETDSTNLLSIAEKLESLMGKNPSSPNTPGRAWEFQHLMDNIHYTQDGWEREEILTTNFISIYQHLGMENQKVYGYYGLGHTLLARINDEFDPMACRLQQELPALAGKILSTNFVFADSYMVMKNEHLPSYMQDEGGFTRVSVSYDNIWLGYLYGIQDLMRVTAPRTQTIFRLNTEGTPYATSQRLADMTKILPIGQTIKSGEGLCTLDYMQYVILVRNSDWAEPIAKE